jgi:hypothetical protein
MQHPGRSGHTSNGAPRMHGSVNPLTGGEQSLYFDQEHPTMPGWFKGMEQIIQGVWSLARSWFACRLLKEQDAPLTGMTAAAGNSL